MSLLLTRGENYTRVCRNLPTTPLRGKVVRKPLHIFHAPFMANIALQCINMRAVSWRVLLAVVLSSDWF